MEGVSTRRVDDLIKALGCDGISSSQVSRICEQLDEVVDSFLGRPLDGGPYPYVWLDGLTQKVREGGRCPASTIFAGWRQSVLPVHLLGLAPLLGSVGPVAGDVKLQDDGVVHDPVNRRGGGHGVGKDALPLREDQV